MAENSTPIPPARPLRAVCYGCMAGVILAFVGELGKIMVGTNLREVVPGAVYRSAQLSGTQLEKVIRARGIRTVVNFRGCCDPAPWYRQECLAVSRSNASLEDIPCSAGRLPSIPALRRLIEIFDKAEHPILLHCNRGVDRTGLASAMALILYSDASLEEAQSALSLRYLHLDAGRTAMMDRFLSLYESWLASTGQQHSRETFRRWALEEYTAGECLAEIVLLEPGGEPVIAPLHKPFGIRVRCWNRSSQPWHMTPASSAGVHAQYAITTSKHQYLQMDRSGLFYATILPGEKVDLTLPIAPIHEPGTYLLRADMIDEQHAPFYQEGSEPLFVQVEVR